MAQEISNVPISWVIVPAAWRIDEPPAADTQLWLMTLTGTADVNFASYDNSDWHHETFILKLDVQSPISWAYGQQPPPNTSLAFKAVQWAPFATINSIYVENPSIYTGYAVDSCQPLFQSWPHPSTLFESLEVVVGVRGAGAYLYKVGFQVTLLGRILLVNVVD
jgi:hypothetical protein